MTFILLSIEVAAVPIAQAYPRSECKHTCIKPTLIAIPIPDERHVTGPQDVRLRPTHETDTAGGLPHGQTYTGETSF